MDPQPSDLTKLVRLTGGRCFKCGSSDHKASSCQAADETNLSLEELVAFLPAEAVTSCLRTASANASGPDFDSRLTDGLSRAAWSEAARRREQKRPTHVAGTSRTDIDDAEAPVPATPAPTIPQGAVVIDLTVESPPVSPVRTSPPHPFHQGMQTTTLFQLVRTLPIY